MAYESCSIRTFYTSVHEGSATEVVPMETLGVKQSNEPNQREQRFSARYPFAADAEILDLKSGVRLSGMTSDLSLGGCFVCTHRSLEVGARVHLTLKYKKQSVIMLATVRVLKPGLGVGLQAQELDSSSIGIFLRWIDGLRESR